VKLKSLIRRIKKGLDGLEVVKTKIMTGTYKNLMTNSAVNVWHSDSGYKIEVILAGGSIGTFTILQVEGSFFTLANGIHINRIDDDTIQLIHGRKKETLIKPLK
jgi:hypothetical protein